MRKIGVRLSLKPAEAAASYFPNHVLLTQDNKPVHFFDDLLKGKTVMINFAFSTCAGVCSPMTANLSKAQEFLGDRVGRDINMIKNGQAFRHSRRGVEDRGAKEIITSRLEVGSTRL